MSPELDTPAHLQTLLDELSAREDRFHAACWSATPAAFDRIVAPDFWEIGASGRRYSRAYCLQALAERAAAPPQQAWTVRDRHLRELGPDRTAELHAGAARPNHAALDRLAPHAGRMAGGVPPGQRRAADLKPHSARRRQRRPAPAAPSARWISSIL
ncbi:MAG: DUF4440 domain-containing protein [Variovorax sp.]